MTRIAVNTDATPHGRTMSSNPTNFFGMIFLGEDFCQHITFSNREELAKMIAECELLMKDMDKEINKCHEVALHEDQQRELAYDPDGAYFREVDQL